MNKHLTGRPVASQIAYNTMITTVQILRGVAVLLVVFFHGSHMVSTRYGVAPFLDLFRYGFSGVFLFFVLSGFIILAAHRKDIGVPRNLFYYGLRRIIRIYPLYWLIFMVWGGWKLFGGSMAPREFALNAFLFMSDTKLVIPVSWTLLYEIIFYGIFALLILNRRLGILTILVWVAGVALSWGKFSSPVLDPFNLLFFFGLIAGVAFFRITTLLRKTREVIGMGSALAGLTLFIGTAILYSQVAPDDAAWPNHPVTILGFGVTSALLLLGATSEVIENRARKSRALQIIGNASYAIYLVHIQIEKIALNATRAWSEIWQSGAANGAVADLLLLYIATLAIGVGILIHLKIERPMLGFLRSKLAPARTQHAV